MIGTGSVKKEKCNSKRKCVMREELTAAGKSSTKGRKVNVESGDAGTRVFAAGMRVSGLPLVYCPGGGGGGKATGALWREGGGGCGTASLFKTRGELARENAKLTDSTSPMGRVSPGPTIQKRETLPLLSGRGPQVYGQHVTVEPQQAAPLFSSGNPEYAIVVKWTIWQAFHSTRSKGQLHSRVTTAFLAVQCRKRIYGTGSSKSPRKRAA
jgi:hypothetical protein